MSSRLLAVEALTGAFPLVVAVAVPVEPAIRTQVSSTASARRAVLHREAAMGFSPVAGGHIPDAMVYRRMFSQGTVTIWGKVIREKRYREIVCNIALIRRWIRGIRGTS
ncbi:hypothetical protein GCM10022252_41750 [Streptosporangium oxazolinicum]|uniref:Secreted protein n=1 Tax=Streptosporangium oxazolinicum TaxID=909287 RepID=A0ABP8B141_9ACTN